MLHLVASALPGLRPFQDAGLAGWFWLRVRRLWPDALAACLMPDHVHVIVAGGDDDAARLSMARLLGQTCTRFGVSRLFDKVPLPAMIPNAKHLERHVRYVHLNPCRDRLVDDPLRWPFSTHRGVIGAIVDPWVSEARLANALGRGQRGFARRFHAYVSGDPTVAPEGTPFPVASAPRETPGVPLDFVLRAALAATPWSRPPERRAVALALARRQGWTNVRSVARELEMKERAARYAILRCGASSVAAAALCLGDERLLGAPLSCTARHFRNPEISEGTRR
jgi:hypothetical protein